MERSLEHEIRERLVDYLIDQSSLDDFKVWLAATTWHTTDADPNAIRLANEIKLVLAEHSGGFIEDREMHEDLRALLQRGEVVLAVEATPRTRSGSSSESITHHLTFPGSVVGISRARVSVS